MKHLWHYIFHDTLGEISELLLTTTLMHGRSALSAATQSHSQSAATNCAVTPVDHNQHYIFQQFVLNSFVTG